jgi:hypothetical protein
MGSALHMGSSATLAGDLALFIGVHRSEPTSPAFPFFHHCDPLLFLAKGDTSTWFFWAIQATALRGLLVPV